MSYENSLTESEFQELVEADALSSLQSLMEEVGYTLEVESLDEALEAAAEFLESAEFQALSEEEKSKIKAGFKMVFGKLRKLGQNVKAVAKELATNKNSRQMVKDYVASGAAKQDAKAAIGRKVNKALMSLDKKAGGKISKGITKLGSWLNKKTGGKLDKALDKMQDRRIAKRKAQDANIQAYYKKSVDKQAAAMRAKKESVSERMSALLAEADDAQNQYVGMTILKQMGGQSRLKAMIGLKTVVFVENGVKLTFPNPQRAKGNGVVITLEPSDTYKMEFFNGNKSVKVYDDVYNDKLKEIFEKQTGLYLSL